MTFKPTSIFGIQKKADSCNFLFKRERDGVGRGHQIAQGVPPPHAHADVLTTRKEETGWREGARVGARPTNEEGKPKRYVRPKFKLAS